MVPKAVIVHQTNDRLRLRIRSRRGDEAFFTSLQKQIEDEFPAWSALGNAFSGSLLLTGKSISRDELTAFGRSRKYFMIDAGSGESKPLALSIGGPMQSANRGIRQLTGARVDLPGAVFFALLGFGIIELIRGNWRTPPWYTAIWYAFGLYSKSVIDDTATIEALELDVE